MKEAMFYSRGALNTVDCKLCGISCRRIADGSTGYCRVRKNMGGKLYSLVYGKACSIAMDPVEKKPFFHFAPGSQCLSVATVGCNFRCLHCQNSEISQDFGEVFGRDVTPEEIVRTAKEKGAQGIAYTYTEPTVFYEYAYDTMKLAKKAGLYNVWVSNGYTMPEAIGKMSRHLHAVNVDIKGDDEFYKNICATKGSGPVYDALREYKKRGKWIEITTLVIQGYNYTEGWIGRMSAWVRKNLGPDTPVHFTAFHPANKLLSAPPTRIETLLRCREIALSQGLRWVYTGNVPYSEDSTKCPECGETVIGRDGMRLLSFRDRCGRCGTKVPVSGRKWATAK